MTAAHTREALEAMRRADLQRLCKDYGVKANLKTEAIIDSILNATNETAATDSAPLPQARQRPTRVPSRALSKDKSNSTIAAQEEVDHEEAQNASSEENAAPVDPDPPPDNYRTTRQKKVKESQSKLGVGRSLGASGSSLPKTALVSKAKRGKSRNLKAAEAVIAEEGSDLVMADAPQPQAGQDPRVEQPTQSEPAREPDDAAANGTPPSNPPVADVRSSLPTDYIRQIFSDFIRPYELQIQSQKSELERLTAQVANAEDMKHELEHLTAEVERLRSQTSIAETQIKQLQAKLDEAEVARASVKMTSPPPRQRTVSSETDRLTAANSSSSNTAVLASDRSREPSAGSGNSSLGKRPRDARTSDVTDNGHEEERDLLEEQDSHHEAKRAKLTPDSEPYNEADADAEADADVGQPGPSSASAVRESVPASRSSNFAVFQGDDEVSQLGDEASYVDPPPPTARLPTSYAAFSTPAPGGDFYQSGRLTATSSANAAENQRPTAFAFNFGAFDPVTSTPYVPSFPFPEPPTSPTPGGSGYRGGRRDRHDELQSQALPGQSRFRFNATSNEGGSTSNLLSTNPSDIMRTPSPPGTREPSTSSHNIAMGLGMSTLPDQEESAPPARGTLYGTELDKDTRFGDFGVGGVATGYWKF